MSSFVCFISNKVKEIYPILKFSISSIFYTNNFNKEFNSVAPRLINMFNNDNFRSYLAGLIEGNGTFALHSKNSTVSIKYLPNIIIVFKLTDLPLAEYLQQITQCGKVYSKPNRGYVLWQIQDIVSVFIIANLINGYMRTPKIESLHRTINWIQNYIINNQSQLRNLACKLNQIQNILSKLKIHPIEIKSNDISEIDSNAWLSGFSDADANFSINIHRRTNKNRIQLYYKLEIKQTYNKLDLYENKVSFFPIMSKIAGFLGVSVNSRSRVLNSNNKEFYSFTVVAHNKNSLLKIANYFNKFPLLSSKYLDYKDFQLILSLQNQNNITLSAEHLNEAMKIRKDFNRTRTTYHWSHLKNCKYN